MFAFRTPKPALIDLSDGQQRLYRLPPISAGPVIVEVRELIQRRSPNGDVEILETAPTALDIELRHADHLSLRGSRIVTESLWHDDLWRLRLEQRPGPSPDPAAPPTIHTYKITATYPSQLPVLERRIPATFFHDGFQANWNRQGYIKLRFAGNRIQILVHQDLAALYGLQTKAEDVGAEFQTFTEIETSPVTFPRTVEVATPVLDVGAGSLSGEPMLFFNVRAQVPSLDLDFEIPVPFLDQTIEAFEFTMRFHLGTLKDQIVYTPVVRSDLLDRLDFDVPLPDPAEGVRKVNLKQVLTERIERTLRELQVSIDSSSKFGDFVKPWFVGGPQELYELAYAPGDADQPGPDGITLPATGDLIVRHVGAPRPPDTTPTLMDPTRPPSAPVDDRAAPLFDVPEEEPDPQPAAPESEGTNILGGGRPHARADVGALARIDHIVVLMQENRSFDQVLGYLRRDRGREDVDGLLPPGAPGQERQRNRFANREFVPTRADAADPRRGAATAWPSFRLADPGHGQADTLQQMSDDMGGFVASYARRIGVQDTTDPTAVNLRLVMDYFDDVHLPTYGELAREFAICDRWYTAHVGPTWPNRFVLLSGDLNRDRAGTIEVDNPDYLRMIPAQRPSLFDLLDARGVSWRVYEHGYSFVRLFRSFTFDVTNVLPFDDAVRGFEAAARGGTLPAVTFIEPDYIDLPPGNDDHPPADMALGQELVRRIVRALIDSPLWERTMLIITYDEHGGFYDHRNPPADAAPLGGSLTKLGPRVPAFIVSPLVERGGVVGRRFDHTSIGATILRRFCGRNVPSVSPRMDAANDLRSALTRADAPRPRSEFSGVALRRDVAAPRDQIGAAARSRRIGRPVRPDDFHGMLAAMRLTTGQPRKSTGARRREPHGTSGELLYYRDRARDGTGDVANPAMIGRGGWQAMLRLLGAGGGILYAVDRSGRLLFYRDRHRDGTGDVANPSVIGKGGWQSFAFLMSGGDGILYAVDSLGRLLFYRDRHRDGTGDVANPTVIGSGGWKSFSTLFAGDDGEIYAVDRDGRLLFYRDAKRDGTGDVANPAVIGRGGWQSFKHVFWGGDGIIYAVDSRGRLLFYRDRTRNGTGDVANPTVIGQGGWQNFAHLVSGGEGVIYAVRP